MQRSALKAIARQALASAGLLDTVRAGIYWSTQFEAEPTHPRRVMRRFFESLFGPGDLVFDVGANVGSRTSIFSEIGARVVAVEPQSACVAELRRRFGRDPRVTIEATAVGEAEGSAKIAICDALNSISSMVPAFVESSRFKTEYGYDWSRTETVPVTTLDALISRHGLPRFCKIDVEGFEQKVLLGLSQPIPCLSFEYNREFAATARACVERLQSLGQYEFNFGRFEPRQLMFAEWFSADVLFYVLDAHPDPLLWGDIYARLPGDEARAE